MTTRLSSVQRAVLEKMAAGCALAECAPLGRNGQWRVWLRYPNPRTNESELLRYATFEALRDSDYIQETWHNAIEAVYRITAEGRAALAHTNSEGVSC